MKKIKLYIVGMMGLILGFLTSCDANFTDINKSPATVYKVDPVSFLYNIQTSYAVSGSSWWDSYACKLRWMQYCSNIWGYSQTNFTDIGYGRSLYDEYNNVGSYTKHIKYYVEQNMPEKLDSYTNIIEVAHIMLIGKGIQAADTWGSLVYTEGWGTKDGHEDLIEPIFQTQEELLELWDNELKDAISHLKSSTEQTSFKNYDMAYTGDITKWVKAANALRLRIALRYMNRNPAKAKSIASEVLSSGEYFQSIDDSFILKFDNYWTTQGDWHSVIDMDRAAAPFMNYLKKYNDPRQRLFFQVNNLTPENVAAYNALPENANKQIPENLTRWEGGPVSYDDRATDPSYQSRYLNEIDMRVMNKPQTRLWKGAQDNGSGGGWVPILTYADFCFMASEFALDGVSSTKTAQQWYEEAVRSSLKQWSEFANYCQINDFQAITDSEIETFMAQEGIAWNSLMAKEQIYSQAYVEHFKNNNESWVQYKRTGYPNQQSTIVTWNPVLVLKQEQKVPTRKKFSYPSDGTANYANEVKRIDDMAKYPDFGEINNEYGRLWWDKK